MAPIAQQIADMVNMLPENDQALAFEVIKKMVLAWDPYYTKLTPSEAEELNRLEAEMDAGEYISDSDVNWN